MNRNTKKYNIYKGESILQQPLYYVGEGQVNKEIPSSSDRGKGGDL